MNTPNKLTLLRFILVFPFVILMLGNWGGEWKKWICLGIFCIASATDALDGYIARKYDLVTNFGKFMDPLADKLLVCSALICLMAQERLPVWAVLIIIAREFIISGFRLVASDNGIVIAAGYWGKIKTICQMVMIIVLIADLGAGMVMAEQILIGLYVALTVISLADYLYKNKQVLSLQD